MTSDVAHGACTVSLAATPGQVTITYTGANVKLSEDIGAALDGAVLPDNLDPKTAHAVLTAAQAARAKSWISHAAKDGELTIKLDWTAA